MNVLDGSNLRMLVRAAVGDCDFVAGFLQPSGGPWADELGAAQEHDPHGPMIVHRAAGLGRGVAGEIPSRSSGGPLTSRRSLLVVFDRLDFVYLPSRDVAADVEHFTHAVGAELVFAIEAFGTRVAMIRLSPDPPALLLAEHLDGDQPVLVHRVPDLEQAIADLEGRGVKLAARFGIPHGPGAELVCPGPQRLALYQLTRPAAPERLEGRRDF